MKKKKININPKFTSKSFSRYKYRNRAKWVCFFKSFIYFFFKFVVVVAIVFIAKRKSIFIGVFSLVVRMVRFAMNKSDKSIFFARHIFAVVVTKRFFFCTFFFLSLSFSADFKFRTASLKELSASSDVNELWPLYKVCVVLLLHTIN